MKTEKTDNTTIIIVSLFIITFILNSSLSGIFPKSLFCWIVDIILVCDTLF